MKWFHLFVWKCVFVWFLLKSLVNSLELISPKMHKERERPSLISSLFPALVRQNSKRDPKFRRQKKPPNQKGQKTAARQIQNGGPTRPSRKAKQPWVQNTTAAYLGLYSIDPRPSPSLNQVISDLPRNQEDEWFKNFGNGPEWNGFGFQFEDDLARRPKSQNQPFEAVNRPLKTYDNTDVDNQGSTKMHQSQLVRQIYPDDEADGGDDNERKYLNRYKQSYKKPLYQESYSTFKPEVYSKPVYKPESYSKPTYKPEKYYPKLHVKKHQKAYIQPSYAVEAIVDFVPIFLAFIPICLCLGGIVAFSLLGTSTSTSSTSSSPTIITIPVSTGTTSTNTGTATNTTVYVNTTTSTTTNPYFYCLLPYLLNTTASNSSFFQQCLLLELFGSGTGTSGFGSLGGSSFLSSILLLFPNLFGSGGFGGLFTGRNTEDPTRMQNDFLNYNGLPVLPPDIENLKMRNLTLYERAKYALDTVTCYGILKYSNIKELFFLINWKLVDSCLYPKLPQSLADWTYDRVDFESNSSRRTA